jgi:hypothetical protein
VEDLRIIVSTLGWQLKGKEGQRVIGDNEFGIIAYCRSVEYGIQHVAYNHLRNFGECLFLLGDFFADDACVGSSL